MELSTGFSPYVQWSGILTLVCLLATIVAFIVKWSERFRLVGVTSFMTVVTAGLFALGLGLFTRSVIPGAVRFSLVYDNGATQAVISVPAEIDESQLDATLRQAAQDLFSYGRNAIGTNNQLKIRARTLLHPEPGVTKPLYLGQVKQTLGKRDDASMEVEIFSKSFAQLKSLNKG